MWRKKGRHRGVYRPNFHWSHIECYPNGICLMAIREIKLTPYVDADGSTGPPLPEAQTFRFA